MIRKTEFVKYEQGWSVLRSTLTVKTGHGMRDKVTYFGVNYDWKKAQVLQAEFSLEGAFETREFAKVEGCQGAINSEIEKGRELVVIPTDGAADD